MSKDGDGHYCQQRYIQNPCAVYAKGTLTF